MGQSRRINIAFISSNDARDKRSLSGSSCVYAELLEKYCGGVSYIHNFRPNKITVGYLLRNLFNEFTWIYTLQKSKEFYWKLLGRSFVWEKTLSVSRYYAKLIERQMKGKDYDVIFSDKGSFCLAYLNSNVPIIYRTDATFKAMENYYPEFMNPAKSFSLGGNEAEKLALEKSAVVITTSQWAANSMIKDYGINAGKIKILPYTVEISGSFSKDAALKEKEHDICKLLFVGVDWKRKGGDIAVETVDWLNREGIKSQLIICGCVPPRKYFANNSIDIIGFLNRGIPSEKRKLEELFLSSHFLILPTRAECLGQVFCEASACGLPVLATNTGGVSYVVVEGKNGFLLSLSSRGSEYGSIAQRLWNDVDQYEALRRSTRKVF